jgi:hypothetical protein
MILEISLISNDKTGGMLIVNYLTADKKNEKILWNLLTKNLFNH